jgi:cell division protein FtsB
MRDFKRRRGATHDTLNFLGLCAGVLLIMGFAGFSARAAWGMYQKFAIASQGHAVAEGELAHLKVQYARVSAAVEDLSSERGVEGQVRERFGVARPGEEAIMIVREGTTTPETPALPKDNIAVRLFRALFVW